MAKAKKKTEDESVPTAPGSVVIKPRVPFDWMGQLKECERTHWRKLRVTIQIREKLMAGKPAQLDAAKAMLKARGLEDAIVAVDISTPEALAAAAESVQDEGLCEFHRREGKLGIWMPTNNLKAGLKENWSVLGYRVEHRGSRGALAEGVFVYSVQPDDADPAERDWLYLGEAPDGIDTSVSHTIGPRGPVSSIKRHEYLLKPRLTFEIAFAVAIADKLPDRAMADTLAHLCAHGIGACRSQGKGTGTIVDIVELTP